MRRGELQRPTVILDRAGELFEASAAASPAGEGGDILRVEGQNARIDFQRLFAPRASPVEPPGISA